MPPHARQFTFDFTRAKPAGTCARRNTPTRARIEDELGVLADWSKAPQLLNISEASILTQVPIKTLYKWHAEGKLAGVVRKLGKQLRFDRDALSRLWFNDKKTAN